MTPKELARLRREVVAAVETQIVRLTQTLQIESSAPSRILSSEEIEQALEFHRGAAALLRRVYPDRMVRGMPVPGSPDRPPGSVAQVGAYLSAASVYLQALREGAEP